DRDRGAAGGRATVEDVVGVGHARAAGVAGAQRDGGASIDPADGGIVGGRGRGEIDAHVHRVMRLLVAGGVHAPVLDGVYRLAADRDRGPAGGRATVEDVVGVGHARAAGVAGAQRHRRATVDPAAGGVVG